jgi:SAM-dependent methyltransferase
LPDIAWNRIAWDRDYDWSGRGEEWSVGWGGSEPQWFGSLYPRLHRFLPTKSILELAPGFGRWTRFLVHACESYVGIDLSEKCVEECSKSFLDANHARFFANDGYSLALVADASCDLVFSFDSLVHSELDVLEAYVPQIINKLRDNGVAFIHHSNLGAFGNAWGRPHARASSVSRENIERLIDEHGGTVLIQEIINWGGVPLLDCITLFGKKCAYKSGYPIYLVNDRYMEEARLIQEYQRHYSIVTS